jgi:Glycosyl transferases group 1
LMWVGGLEHPDPGTHIAQLAAAPRELPLVLVGPTRPWAHELPGVILTGQVPDDDLAAIYSGAHALVISDEQEGFGLPAVEALACGTPVAASDGPALREVLGARATFVPAGDMRALVEAAQRTARPAPSPRHAPPGPSTPKPPRTRANAPPPASCAGTPAASRRSNHTAASSAGRLNQPSPPSAHAPTVSGAVSCLDRTCPQGHLRSNRSPRS